MAVTFSVQEHSLKPGVGIVSVMLDGTMVAMIYPEGEKGIKLVSAHMEGVVEDDGSESEPPIPSVQIRFDPQSYAMDRGSIIRHPRR